MKKSSIVVLGLLATSVVSMSENNIRGYNKKQRALMTDENVVGVDTYSFHDQERAKESGAKGSIEIGMDTMIFERSVDEKNRIEPYLAFEVFPFEDSNFYIDGKTSYRHEYHTSEKRYNKTMVELYGGSIYRKGDFFLNYKIGLRHDELIHTKVQHSTTLRFIPKATYDFTDKFGWYLKGAVGYAVVQGDERNEKTKQFDLPFEDESFVNKLETGLSYRISKSKLSLGVVNKSKEDYAGENIRWTYLAKLDHNLYTTDKVQIRPYIWGFLNPEVETGGNRNKTTLYNELVTTIGTRAIWNPTSDLSLTADLVYIAQYKNVSNNGSGSGSNSGKAGINSGNGNNSGGGTSSGGNSGTTSIKRSVEEAMVIRLGFKKYF